MCDVSAIYIDPKYFQTKDICGNHHYTVDMCHNHYHVRDMCHNHYDVLDMCHNHYNHHKQIIFIDPSNFSNHNHHGVVAYFDRRHCHAASARSQG